MLFESTKANSYRPAYIDEIRPLKLACPVQTGLPGTDGPARYRTGLPDAGGPAAFSIKHNTNPYMWA
ncbi:MAG: hypothetical protein GXO89_08115 [Chlorobi bacterium]|nr:hypothetical protein [Chlorobiota bacterium]